MITTKADPVLLIYPLEKDEAGKPKPGFPVPIYLSEEITGICVDSEEDSLSISTDYIPVVNGKKMETSGESTVKLLQRGETQQTRIRLVASKNSIGLNVLLPFVKSIFSRVFAKKEYKIAYFHESVLIFNARLASYEMTPGANDTKVNMTLTLEVAPEKSKEDNNTPDAIARRFEEIPF